MTTEQIKQNDIIIAKFMGYVLLERFNQWVDPEQSNLYIANEGFLKFSHDWNALMTVVEKIETTHVATSVVIAPLTIINAHDKYKNETEYIKVGGKSKIENTYHAVIAFINWYNQQQK